MGKLHFAVALALLGVMTSGAQASHQQQPHHARHAHPIAGRGAAVYIGRHPVLTLYGVSKADAHRRAALVQSRVDRDLKCGIPGSKIALRKVKRVLEITWGGHVVTTIDGLQAHANHMKPHALGAAWVHAMRRAAHRETFAAAETSVTMAVGDVHSVMLTGDLPGVTTVAGVDHPILSADVNNQTHRLTLKATGPGNTILKLQRGHVQIPVHVTVRESAGQLPTELACVVTGDPATRPVVNDALMYAIKGSVHLSPGAKIYLRGEPALPDALQAGQQATLVLPLSLEGPNLVPVKRSVRVTVHNRPTLMSDATLLMVSNRPESVDGNGVVFSGKFGPGRPARLLYAHTNTGNMPRQVCVTLTNRSDKPADVFLIGVPGVATANATLSASTSEAGFLQRCAQSAGVVLSIPAHTGWEVLQATLPPQEHLVGLAHLECLNGEDIEVTVQARENGVPLTVANRTVLADGAVGNGHPKGTFASPNQQLQATYRAGDPAQTVDIGKGTPLVDTSTSESDTGNLGVLYHLTMRLTNPTDGAQKVDVAYGAGDTPSRACFLLGGKTQDTTLVPANTEAPLQTVELGPHDTRTVDLTTLGTPGASLPAHIVIRTETAPVSVNGGVVTSGDH